MVAAREKYSKALSVDESNVLALTLAGAAAARCEAWEEAESRLLAATRANPNDYDAW
jgi:hypothetical protein